VRAQLAQSAEWGQILLESLNPNTQAESAISFQSSTPNNPISGKPLARSSEAPAHCLNGAALTAIREPSPVAPRLGKEVTEQPFI
jgi:hypothetical protein